MARESSKPPKRKISPEFARRLARLAHGAMARAVVLLDTGPVPSAAPGRTSKPARKEVAEAIRTTATPALWAADRQLERSGGRRLAPGPDLFGSIPVEAPASTLLALGRSEHVRALVEDQPLSLLHNPSR
jgi:hypothetical protein